MSPPAHNNAATFRDNIAVIPLQRLKEKLLNYFQRRTTQQAHWLSSVLLSWLHGIRTTYFTYLVTIIRKLPALHSMGSSTFTIPRLIRGLLLLLCALMTYLVPVLAWWFVKQHCIPLVYRAFW
jgi:hypothetical protein